MVHGLGTSFLQPASAVRSFWVHSVLLPELRKLSLQVSLLTKRLVKVNG